MTISTKRKEKCLAQARKQVRFEHKWGRCGGTFQVLAAFAFLGAAVLIYNFVVGSLIPMAANANNAAQNQVQDAMKQGWALGLLLGFLSGYAILKGAFLLYEGVQTFRGDARSHILVEYQDALESLLKTENEIHQQPDGQHEGRRGDFERFLAAVPDREPIETDCMPGTSAEY